MSNIKIYVASPYGFSEAGRVFLYGKIIPIIEKLDYVVLDPWKLSKNVIDSVNAKEISQEEANTIMGENNEKAIMKSTGLCAILDGVDVDSGVASEVGVAYGLGKPILGYRGDFRQTGENNAATVNLQVEYWIKKSGGHIIKSIDELAGALKSLF